jgi:prophage regulatory protein
MCGDETTSDLDRILRIDEVLAVAGISASTVWREVAAGRFPGPVPISKRGKGWLASDIRAWLASRQVTSPH